MFNWFKFKRSSKAQEEKPMIPREPRVNTFAEAYIVNQYNLKTPGALVNLSPTGACLRFMSLSGILLSDKIEVRVPMKSIRESATVIWRDNNQIGVEFNNTMTRSRINRA